MSEAFSEAVLRSQPFPERLTVDGNAWVRVGELILSDTASTESYAFAVHDADDEYRIPPQRLRYPDGETVEDAGLAHEGGYCEFTVGGITPGRDLLILRRSDYLRGDYRAEIHVDGEPLERPLVVKGSDRRHRWRNWAYVVPGRHLVSTAPVIRQVVVTPDQPINMFRFWFYQREPDAEVSLFGVALDQESPVPADVPASGPDEDNPPEQQDAEPTSLSAESTSSEQVDQSSDITPPPATADDSIEWRAPSRFDTPSATQDSRPDAPVLDDAEPALRDDVVLESLASQPPFPALPTVATEPPSPWSRLDEAEIAAVRKRLFLPVDCLEGALCELLAGRHLSIQGPPGSGRKALAVHLAKIMGAQLSIASHPAEAAALIATAVESGGWVMLDAQSLPPPLAVPAPSDSFRLITRLGRPLPPEWARHFAPICLNKPADARREWARLLEWVPIAAADSLLLDALFSFLWLARTLTPIGTGVARAALRQLAASYGAPMTQNGRLTQCLRSIVAVLPAEHVAARNVLAAWCEGGDLGGALRKALEHPAALSAHLAIHALGEAPAGVGRADQLVALLARPAEVGDLMALAQELRGA